MNMRVHCHKGSVNHSTPWPRIKPAIHVPSESGRASLAGGHRRVNGNIKAFRALGGPVMRDARRSVLRNWVFVYTKRRLHSHI
ncbi:unnamed protein product, partial [Iphiclides podalirius]